MSFPVLLWGLGGIGRLGLEPLFWLQGWSGGLYGTQTQSLGEQWHHLTAGFGWRGCVRTLPLGTQASVGPGSAPAPVDGR